MQVFFSGEVNCRASMFSSVIKSQLKLVVDVSLNWIAGALLKEPSDRALPGTTVFRHLWLRWVFSPAHRPSLKVAERGL